MMLLSSFASAGNVRLPAHIFQTQRTEFYYCLCRSDLTAPSCTLSVAKIEFHLPPPPPHQQIHLAETENWVHHAVYRSQ
jgi:hypothetical protein